MWIKYNSRQFFFTWSYWKDSEQLGPDEVLIPSYPILRKQLGKARVKQNQMSLNEVQSDQN